MISDATLLVDGQVDWSGGMDSNLSPQLIAPNSVARAVNVTFRGGKPTNRPGFSQLALSDGVGSGLDLFSSGYYQGGFFYSETRGNKDSSLICVVDGYVVKINLSTYVVDRLYPRTAAGADDTAHRLDAVSRCYFARAERYLVIQDGVNTPLIWDGDYLYQSGVGPTLSTGAVSQIHNVGPGTIMAYGQGRLFVTNASRTKIFAGDLVYGGSTTQIEITSGVASGGKYRLTTTSNHGFAAGDVISISGHSSEHFINGTWEISAIPASTTFDIDYSDTSATGTGGYVSKANAGQESDLLKFTELTYLNEGGALQPATFLGKITGLTFVPIQDTGTGQGDLIVFCERGVVSLSVSVPRTAWKTTSGFQRISLTEIGCTSHDSISSTNGDIFFRAFDGLRSYRNSRAERSDYGQVPISTEMNYVLDRDSRNYLNYVSSTVFDNRLLFTCSPKVDYSNSPILSTGKRRPVTFSGLVALDFTSITGTGGKRSPAYDGIWTGLDVVQLYSGSVAGIPKAYAVNLDYVNSGLLGLWEITKDREYDIVSGGFQSPISSILETRAMSLGNPLEQKRLIRADFWLAELNGEANFNIYWRPDEYPCWRPWHSFSRCATVENCVTGTPSVSESSGNWTLTYSSSALRNYRIVADKKYTSLLSFAEQANDSSTVSAALTAAGITHASVSRSGTFPSYVYTITGPVTISGTTVTNLIVTPVQDPATQQCDAEFSAKNFRAQYRPQIRMPTPSEDVDPIVNKPYTYGNDFQVRIEWSGKATVSRFLILCQRILEQYQGIDYVELG